MADERSAEERQLEDALLLYLIRRFLEEKLFPQTGPSGLLESLEPIREEVES